MIVLSINFKIFRKNFWINCPFVIDDVNYKDHIRRRCDLYDRNFNSRYSYQYICSYDPSNDFKYLLSHEIKPDNIVCLKYNNSIKNNNITKSFINVYKKEKIFYCGRTNKPKKYSNVKPKNCSDSKYRQMLAFIILAYLRILFVGWLYCMVYLYPLEENPNMIPDMVNISRKSTIESEISKENENFEAKKTVNIIIEQKKAFIVDVNIQDLEPKDNNINNNDLHLKEKNSNINSDRILISD